ncbi:tyrosine-type recombinase/integrase [Thiomicrorhabdus sp.]|uniref:tyrosine-type recombinase/integrase n=1 Tax=Thiomicrorhabdus sp. TaxID=2039724 RepID=UPI00356AD870
MSIKKRGQTWYTDFVAPNGQRVRKSTKTKVKREAQEFCAKLRNSLWREYQLGEKPKRRYTWREAVVRYLQLKEGTKWENGIKIVLRDLHIWLEDVYLDEIDAELISRITFERKAMKPRSNKGKGETVKNSTVNRMLRTLNAILRLAYEEWEWIDRKPKVPTLKEEPTEVTWLTNEQVKRLKNEMPHHQKQMMLFSVLTGLRESNMTGLTWEQVQLESKVIIFGNIKMKNGDPLSIPLSKQAIDILKEEMGKHPEYVFTYRGRPIKRANTKAFKKALSRAGIEPMPWHKLRHTFASFHRQQKTPLDILQELGGWKSQEMVKRYAHLGIDHLAEYANNISVE